MRHNTSSLDVPQLNLDASSAECGPIANPVSSDMLNEEELVVKHQHHHGMPLSCLHVIWSHSNTCRPIKIGTCSMLYQLKKLAQKDENIYFILV